MPNSDPDVGNARDGFMMPVGFQADLKPRETRTLICDPAPSLGFAGRRIVIPADAPERFMVVGIVSVGRNQLGTDRPVSAAALGPDSEMRFAMEPTTEEMPLVEIVVTNVVDEPATFRAALVGRCPPKPRTEMPIDNDPSDPFAEEKRKLDSRSIALIQNLQEGAPVRLVRAVITGKLPPFLVLETDLTETTTYRLELIVVAAHVIPLPGHPNYPDSETD